MIGKLHTLPCHPAQVWGFYKFLSKRFDISIAHVVGDDEDDIWFVLSKTT
jgi:hypothetical protein